MSNNRTLPIKTKISYPRVVNMDSTYIMTIDLQPEEEFTWEVGEEEYPIYCSVESELFSCKSIREPVVLLHRFGGNYGSANFLISTSHSNNFGAEEDRSGQIKILFSNKYGASIREITLDEIQISAISKSNKLSILNFLPSSSFDRVETKYVNLSNQGLDDIPNDIGKLKNIETLILNDNNITKIPESITQLTSLQELDLSNNQLTSLPESISQLSNLTRLNLSSNRLTSLPESLSQLSNLKQLYLHENEALELVIEILGPSWKDVRDNNATPNNPQDLLRYYYRIQGDRQPLNEAKLTLVGFGGVGKTSLVNSLIHEIFDSNSKKTEGIQITQWPIRLHGTEDVTVHVWDFDGQEIMHSTHQFFLTERSIYLLVLNGRQGHEDEDAEYWLELIQSLGGDSPVIVVFNKISENPFDVSRRTLQQKFPSIHAFIQTDCKTGIGIKQLRTLIEQEIDRLEYLRIPFPTSWISIKNRLNNMQDNYISFETYQEICRSNGETDPAAQDFLAAYLHSLGIVFNYKDDPRLRDTHILNPYWVTNGIYTLLNAPELTDARGELDLTFLQRHLDPNIYPPERHDFLLSLMRKFELCFPFGDDNQRYLIPSLLDKQQPEAVLQFDPTECLNFRYEYPILPEGLMPRFIVRTHALSQQQLRWRNGVILDFESNRALIKADHQDRYVTISVKGSGNSRRRLLSVIRSDFERIHMSFKFRPQEQVPVPQHPTVFINYQELLTREKAGQTTFDIFTGNSLLTLNVRDLLNGVNLDSKHQDQEQHNRQKQALRLFYIYSHKDETLRNHLETHLKLLQRQGLIQPWYDRRITAGENWEKRIDENLNRADIILLLISADFIASDYNYGIEIEQVMKRHHSGEARVIPIILRPTDWSNTSFSKLQAFPTNAKPVTSWSNRDEAWLNIETAIREVITDMKNN